MSATLSAGSHTNSAPLASLVYCSRSVEPLTQPELQHLLNTAQARNRVESITGLVLYDNNRFYQWLEGPAPNVARIMDSIHRDPRHTDIRILDDKPIESRFFADWDMKLATPNAATGAWVRDVIDAPSDLTENLRADPNAAPSLLVKLVPLPKVVAGTDQSKNEGHIVPPRGRVAAILRDVMLATVIPQLAHTNEVVPRTLPVDKRMGELVSLLVDTDPQAALEFMRALQAKEGSLAPLYATLLEPAARSLGNLWSQDLCSEFDVTVGLCRMQTAVRLMGINVALPRESALVKPAVLVAPEPGEMHHLTAALDSDMLRRAGWAPATEYPETDKALQDIVSQNWFDALDLSLSASFTREHWLPRVAHTIELARHASQNPALVVLVGGRAFVERGEAGHEVGADASVTTARQMQSAILRLLREAKAKAA